MAAACGSKTLGLRGREMEMLAGRGERGVEASVRAKTEGWQLGVEAYAYNGFGAMI